MFNNPEEHGYVGTPEEICNRLKAEWIGDSSTRSGRWAYCISAKELHHVHMVLEDTVAMRFSKVKECYADGMHFEATKGSKKQVEDYINKRGEFEEKGETVVCQVGHGDICGKQGKRNDLEEIDEMLKQGYKPKEILKEKTSYYRYENIITKSYFDKIKSEHNYDKNIEVLWICGDSGTGKSHSRKEAIQEYGADEVYYLTDFQNGGFDNYKGEKVLWIEDLKGELSFNLLLRILDKYYAEIHSRYANVLSCWEKVIITSVHTPYEMYEMIVPSERVISEPFEQLRRRINKICYFFIFEGEYKRYIHESTDIKRSELDKKARENQKLINAEVLFN